MKEYTRMDDIMIVAAFARRSAHARARAHTHTHTQTTTWKHACMHKQQNL